MTLEQLKEAVAIWGVVPEDITSGDEDEEFKFIDFIDTEGKKWGATFRKSDGRCEEVLDAAEFEG